MCSGTIPFFSKEKKTIGSKVKGKVKGGGILNFGKESKELKQMQGLVQYLCELETRWRAYEEVTDEIILAYNYYDSLVSYVLHKL